MKKINELIHMKKVKEILLLELSVDPQNFHPCDRPVQKIHQIKNGLHVDEQGRASLEQNSGGFNETSKTFRTSALL